MKMNMDDVERYLHEILGLGMQIIAWNGNRDLPLYLRESYELYEASIDSFPCLLACPNGEEHSLVALCKQLGQLQAAAGRIVVYVPNSITSYSRKRLIQDKQPFIVPGSQIYLPQAGMVFRERATSPRKAMTSLLSPAAQMLILHILNRENPGESRLGLIAAALGYSIMSVSRAMDELESRGLVLSERRDRARTLTPAMPPASLWKEALQYLRDPVEKTVFVAVSDLPTGALIAGLSALATRSMLVAPTIPEYALARRTWAELVRSDHVQEIPLADVKVCRLHLWRYDPAILAQEGSVDPLSLYLSLRNSDDERTIQALEAMMAGLSWR